MSQYITSSSSYTLGKIEEKQITYFNPRQYRYISRYRNRKIINKKYHESVPDYLVPYSNNDIYHIVDNITENRLDIISQMYYGTSVNWWFIALANNIIDPFNIPVGSSLRIPEFKSVHSTMGGL